MPSPFPGMDPYLEDPALWPDVHHELISVAREMLLAALRPRYFIQIDERLYVANDDDEARSVIIPDIRVRDLLGAGEAPRAMSVLTAEPGIQVDADFQIEVRESRLKIIDRQDNQVVTIIEILSPANKVKGSQGRTSYAEKKHVVLTAHTNLVEIDLLRDGIPLYRGKASTPQNYMAQLWHWMGDHYSRWIWPMRLEQRLKTIPIPVRQGDADAALDLQAMLNTAYNRAGYELRIDYSNEPVSPLPQRFAEWARNTIATREASA
ncbi:MAG TPA: DUF4058 family protein [Tepidisphaeraceae bacterium]|nr:DUF4058 family protein [Tepidisphaeraceae bacterium]